MTADARRDLTADLPPEYQEAIKWAKRQGRIPPGPHGGHDVDRPATGGSDGPGWGATAPDVDGDVVRYGVGG